LYIIELYKTKGLRKKSCL